MPFCYLQHFKCNTFHLILIILEISPFNMCLIISLLVSESFSCYLSHYHKDWMGRRISSLYRLKVETIHRRVVREEYYMCHLVCGIIKTTTIVRHWVSRQKSSPKNSFCMSLGSMCNPILSKVFAMRSASRWMQFIDSSRVLRPMYIL